MPRMSARAWRGLALVLGVVALLVGVRPAAGQDSGGDSEGEISLSASSFGVGGVTRPGDWTGIRLGVKESSDKQREVLIRIALTDPDGDRVLYERAVTTNPGVDQPLWMYLRLPARFSAQDLLRVEAFAAVEQAGSAPVAGADERVGFAYGAGKLLGSTRIAPARLLAATDGMMGIVGTQYLGLQKYHGLLGQNTPLFPTGHERTELVTGLAPGAFPDRWMGLMPYDVIVWNQAPPSALSGEAAEALREWVKRGGHLVVVLPRVGETWSDEQNNPLYDITPRVRVDRREGVSLEPLRALITSRPAPDSGDARADALAMPTNEVLQTFAPVEGSAPEEAVAILSVPGQKGPGGAIVVRRLVGTGMVTLVGLDVASRWMQDHGGPDPQLFWHRVLGRRGELWSDEQFQAIENGKGPNASVRAPFREQATILDQGIPGQINMQGFAATGVFLGFIVFVAYWLVAGPLGFALLKRTGLVRHAWVGFAAAAAVFTALAWGGATAIRPGRLDARHFTVFEHVYGQNTQRARSFVSIHVPQYGEATLAVGDPALRASQTYHNTIAPFDTEGTAAGNFPDARGYRVDCKNPDQVTYPSRSTVKQFQIDWAGGAWKMPRPVKADGSPGDIRIEGDPESSQAKLRGILVHNLPAAIKDAVIVVVLGEKDVAASDASPGNPGFLVRARAGKLPAAWEPGEPLDLSTTVDITRVVGTGAKMRDLREYLRELSGHLGEGGLAESADVSAGTFLDRMYAMTFFQQLEPPFLGVEQKTNFEKQLLRKHTHGQDVSAFMTEPCVIIVGEMEGPCPAPLYVSTGGSFREVASSGMTVVRWVYPLAGNLPGMRAGSAEPAVGGGGGGGE